jgi:hypothetical protein
MKAGAQGDASILKDLLSQIPGGLFGSSDQAGKADELQANSNAARLQNMHVTPKRPEAITQQMLEITKQIYPVIEFHDDIMRSISQAIERIPVLPELIEQLEDQINVFVFSLLAPFMIPVINQIKVELNQGSSEIIQSSQDKQLIVFHDDHSTDPTHSMLSKDHFSDVLNEPAGRVASQTVGWVVPQLMQCWDDGRIDPTRTINRIINGVFHHPAQRNMGDDGAADCRRLMFSVVEQWWRSANQQDLRQQLSREGVQRGLNHKPGEIYLTDLRAEANIEKVNMIRDTDAVSHLVWLSTRVAMDHLVFLETYFRLSAAALWLLAPGKVMADLVKPPVVMSVNLLQQRSGVVH